MKQSQQVLATGTFIRWTEHPNSHNLTGWIVAENGCHIWTGTRNNGGYGQVWADRKLKLTHRVRYEREVGPIPKGMVLDHFACDNGSGGCCNPLHVRPVTHQENALRSNSRRARRLPPGPTKAAAVLRFIAVSPTIAPEARDAILAGLRLDRYTPHPGCPCERCARVYGVIP